MTELGGRGVEVVEADVPVRNGYVLVKLGKMTGEGAARTAAAARELPGVERVELVTGPFDLILHLQAPGGRSESPDLLVARVQALSGVLRALPCWVSEEVGPR